MEPIKAEETPLSKEQSKDEVDFVYSNNNNEMAIDKNNLSQTTKPPTTPLVPVNKNKKKERGMALFAFGRRADTEKSEKSEKSVDKAEKLQKDPKLQKHAHKFVKSSSIARLFGNTYNAKKFEKQEEQKKHAQLDGRKFNTFGGRRRAESPFLDRFKRYAKEDGDVASNIPAIAKTNEETILANGSARLTLDSRDLYGGSRSELFSLPERPHLEEDLSVRAMRHLTRGLGKLWFRRTHSVDISSPDPEHKVSYLGNVLTGWAKGEGCVEKQLNTLWRNYTQNTKPDVIMRIKVCASGLKATTRQHGLTEYWANRITHCCAPANYPRVFCWVYRHEGRKLKHELRCHAVLCSKEKMAQDICQTLKGNLESALRDFKREKILKQNARLSLANAAYDNPSLPRRKILLSVGGNNYRPPLERSKSAPKLMAIEEAIGEEEGEEIEETNEPEMKSCCQKDSLYPAMTLGRRRCRRGHSIRRTGKLLTNKDINPCANHKHIEEIKPIKPATTCEETEQCNSSGSDESDDFEKILLHNNYDSRSSLTNELIPYFDLQLHKNNSQSLGSLCELKHVEEEEPLSLIPTINTDPNAHPAADLSPTDSPRTSVRRDGVCSDGEEDYICDEELDAGAGFDFCRRSHLLNRESMRKMAQYSLSSDEGTSSLDTNHSHQPQSSISSDVSSTSPPLKQQLSDSDEGSISSGCETASIATANQDEIAWRFPQLNKLSDAIHNEELPISAEEIYQRLESRLQVRHNSDATTFSSSSSITLKHSGADGSPAGSECALDSVNLVNSSASSVGTKHRRRQTHIQAEANSDSECSDESGYVEFQEKELRSAGPQAAQRNLKPDLPPKPMPRRLSSIAQDTAV